MGSLGVLLATQRKNAEAEQWYRKAADAGRTSAMFNLGVLLREQGKDAEAGQWFRKAADAKPDR
jgi:TPR repeat protein